MTSHRILKTLLSTLLLTGFGTLAQTGAQAQSTTPIVIPQNPISYSSDQAATTPPAANTPSAPNVATSPYSGLSPTNPANANKSPLATPPLATTAAPASGNSGTPAKRQHTSTRAIYGVHLIKRHPATIGLSLGRRADLGPQQFVIHLTTDYPVTGCPKVSNLPFSVDYEPGLMKVRVQDYTIDMRHIDASENSCHRQTILPGADIVLGRKDLLDRGIKKIGFQSADSSFDYYDVTVDDEHVQLTPSDTARDGANYFQPLERHAVNNSLVHWFYPKGTVILYVPGIKPDQDVEAAVETMAKRRGLEPLQTLWPDFQSPLAQPQFYYYVDKSGGLTKDPDIEAAAVAGTIPVTKTVYGLEHDETVQQNMKVMARLPSFYE